MHLVNLTTAGIKRIIALTFSLFIYALSFAQDNSPYSRYGIGDVLPAQNMVNRSMGGISAGYGGGYYFDQYGKPKNPYSFSLNFVNPASLGMVQKTILDIGGEVDRRTLKSNTSPDKYTSTNTVISYLQFGVPITTKKMEAKDISWGVSFGIRPATRINYKIEDNKRLNPIDSLSTTYEGSGGLNQVSLSTGVRIKNFSFGVTGGYSFGSKDYSTRLAFINDSVLYYKSNTESKTNFNGGFINLGLLYDIKFKSSVLRLGAYANLQQKLKAKGSMINETFAYDGNGNVVTIDTVDYQSGKNGTIVYPATYSFGFTRIAKNWLYGADFEMTGWDNYSFFGTKDLVKNTWKLKGGVQYYPLKEASDARKYGRLIQYRAGAYFGPELFNIDNNKRSEFGITFGAGLPLTTQRYDFALLNTGVEFGSRGSKQSKSVRESVIRFNIGVSMNATWFQKRKYD